MTLAFGFGQGLRRDTRNAHKILYLDGKNCAPDFATLRRGTAYSPRTGTTLWLKNQDPARMLLLTFTSFSRDRIE